MHCCFKLALTRVIENQAARALLYLQKALAVAQAAKLHGSQRYASMVNTVVNSYANREVSPADLGFRHGEHAIPYEGFMSAVANGQFPQKPLLAKKDAFIQEHTRWVKQLQAELVRCEGLASLHVYHSQLVSPLIKSLCLALRRVDV